jgi:hypothetical protein
MYEGVPMSLSDKLKNASKSSQTALCKLGIVLQSTSVPVEDRNYLKSVLEVEESTPDRIPNSQIGRILREEGYDISNSAVDRHRRKDCSCFRWGKK